MPDSPSQALGIQPGSPDAVVGQLYGWMGWALGIPEVADILRRAAADAATGVAWSQAQMDAALQATEWWKTSNDAKRAWIQKESQNPGEAASEVTQKASTISDQLIQSGVRIDPGRLAEIARQSLEFGWDDVQTKAALDSELQRSPSVLASRVGVNYKALSDQFGVQISDQKLQKWAADSIAGIRSDDEFRQYLVVQAKGAFKDNADIQTFLDKGGTVDQYFDPFRQKAANLLGVDPDTIHFTDPKWSAAINAQQRDPSGKPMGVVGPMTLSEWESKLKDDPQYGYAKTPKGINEYQGLGATITQLFGGLPMTKGG
jgi:hypothetical protein